VTATLAHEIAWVTAAPLWKDAVKTPSVLRRPTILGFGHDGFMDELLATLSQSPERIADRVATGPSRSYRDRLPGEAYDAKPLVKTNALKLYQPVHGWFYLVAGSLVCQLPGLPDHPVDAGAEETAAFVVRRMADDGSELALVADASGKKSWQPAKDKDLLADGEETFPMFPLGFRESDRRRRLLAGLIPTASQELFQSAPLPGAGSSPQPDGPPPPADALEAVKARVSGQLRFLQTLPRPSPAPPVDESAQREISRFVLLDLADFLTFSLPPAMDSLKNKTALTGKAKGLADLLRGERIDATSSTSPTFGDLLQTILGTDLGTAFAWSLSRVRSGFPDELDAALEEALDEANPGALDAPSATIQVGQTFYVARLVYRRPRCGPLHADVLSPPSEKFLLAPYFDPEAPSRPIRISLPIDASIQGLRQFRKNVRMVLSDSLRNKTKTKKINDKVDGPDLDCGGFDLSIPIITIVAMILLFVMISLLNIIFWWIPFVKICLPKIKVEL